MNKLIILPIFLITISVLGQNWTNGLLDGEPFTARAGRWIGSKVGIFASKTTPGNDSGYADFDWFRFE